MLYTLAQFKDQMFGKGKMTEVGFIETFFPKEFYELQYVGLDGSRYSLFNLLSKSSTGAKAQRNKIFTGKYQGYIFADSVRAILEVRPDLWEQIRAMCLREMRSLDCDILVEILQAINEHVDHIGFKLFLKEAIVRDLATALGASILYMMVRDGQIDKLMPLFRGTVALVEQFQYLDIPRKMMKDNFADLTPSTDRVSPFYVTWRNYSELLSLVTRVTIDRDEVEYDNDLLDLLYEAVLLSDVRYAIQIVGPSAAEKNAITELLYLRLGQDVRSGGNDSSVYMAPYYLNLGYYRSKDITSIDEIRKQLLNDIEPFRKFCERQPMRTPVIFIDGIKRYDFDNDFEVDFILNEVMRDLFPNARFIIAVEQGVQMNPRRQRQLPAFACGEYQYVVNMESIYLMDVQKSKKYLSKFSEIYEPDKKDELYWQLRRLRFDQIDTFQLRLLLPMLFSSGNITDLYEAACLDYLGGDRSKLDDAVNWAYTYAYTDQDPGGISFEVRNLINFHDSFLEFFVAQWYIGALKEVSEGGDVKTINIVLPKGVTRFVRAALNKSSAEEKRVLKIAEKRIHELDQLGKAELAYWLGRIKTPNLAERADDCLERMLDEHKAFLESASREGKQIDKKELFLWQSISISLIERDHRDAMEGFIETLIHDETSNEVNRGFQLEYYGDIPYLPTGDELVFLDNISLGKRALDQLLAANDSIISEGISSPRFEYNLFTICSLLQARIETFPMGSGFKLIPFLNRVVSQLEWYLRSGGCDYPLLWNYFRMVYRDFISRIHEPFKMGSIGGTSFSLYSKRTVWKPWQNRKIEIPESAAEHIYNTWLMGMMLLQEDYSGDPEYDKPKILELILLHNLTEANHSSINEPWNTDMNQDTTELGIMLLRGTYPSLPSQEKRYALWEEWNQTDNINGRIARELGEIQNLYMLLSYYKDGQGSYEVSDIGKLLQSSSIKTIPGLRVYRAVIEQNPAFRVVLDACNASNN